MTSADRRARAALATAMVFSAILFLYFGRDTTFFSDELILFDEAGRPGLKPLFEPHNGHLVLVPRVIFELVFTTVGPEYLLLRVIAVALVLVAAGLFFVLAQRRVGPVLALPGAVLLLFFGSAWKGVLPAFHNFAWVGVTAAGLGAFVALERRSRRGDAIAAALLVVALATASLGLAFLVGAAVAILMRPRAERRWWPIAVPVLLYAAWWLWALQFDEGQARASNVLLIPSYSADAFAAAAAAVAGLNFSFAQPTVLEGHLNFDASWGRPLAALIVVWVGVMLWRRRPLAIGPGLAVPAVTLVVFWVLLSVAYGPGRNPEIERYLYPGAVLLLLTLAGVLEHEPRSRALVIGAFAALAIALPVNVKHLSDAGAFFRSYSDSARAELAIVDLTPAERIPPGYKPTAGFVRTVPELYKESARQFGTLGYSPEELAGADPAARQSADEALLAVSGVGLAAADRPGTDEACRSIGPDATEATAFAAGPPGVLLRSEDATPVKVRRFGDAFGAPIGTLEPGRWTELVLPSDASTQPWTVSVASGDGLRVCGDVEL